MNSALAAISFGFLKAAEKRRELPTLAPNDELNTALF